MTTLTFQNTTLSVINQQNQIWLATAEISKALGYNRSDNLLKLYNSHADEFTPNMTALIDMKTNGGMQKVRIFSLRGCHLIGMLSHTKVAKEFRKWVLDILDRETQQQLALPEPQKPKTIEIDTDVLDALIKYCKLAKRHGEQLEPAMRTIYTSLGLERYIKNNFA
ncbi:Bro-N domain-containing protein, partial [Gallibacterium salpingitidis]|uniref:BRO-N domain-containing protein n=1 Tax=Gallibacterium salpingitidis TaxID=505341 RepID=UPI0009ED89E6